jgi:mono/diheme cytochrome c family protein
MAAGCSRSSGSPQAAAITAPAGGDDAGESLVELREAAREVLDRNCGECHTSTLPTALPRALAVYDLVDNDWSHKMSATELRDAVDRLKSTIAPTLGEGEAKPMQVTDEERARFARYVELEIARRGR